MKKNILQYLEENEKKLKNKTIFAETDRQVSYSDFINHSKKVGTFINNIINEINKPIVIFIDKKIECLEAMFGTIYSGNFYTILDVHSPKERMNLIFKTLTPSMIITNKKNYKKIENENVNIPIYLYEDAIETDINKEKLQGIRNRMIDTDLMYVLFTSGSTGIPKGIAVCHRSAIDYASFIIEKFNINTETVFGSQTPFYFSMSVLDVFSTVMAGATLYIIPKMYFSFPVKLLNFMNDKKINTIYWVPSALSIVANFKALEDIQLPKLKTILFAGEVMPVKQLNYWMNHVDALYANLYGPTEVTDICTYYVVDRKFKNDESLPIGKACNNCNVLIIKDNGKEAKKNEEGELCVRGSFLALGYYNNPNKNKECFIQNPLNNKYPETIYKTGDIVKYNEKGELIFLHSKDFQIIHMGYRIELGEIEKIVNSIEEVLNCACIYDEKESKIVLFYQSNQLGEKQVSSQLRKMLLPYMMPNKIIQLIKMPYNQNGKIDRIVLKNNYINKKYE